MECVKAKKVRVVSHSPVCHVLEYDIHDPDINAAVARISGRYPNSGWSVNLKCKMMGFVLSGFGRIVVEGRSIELSENDLVLIHPGEKYYWEGNMTILMPATPAWNPTQYQSAAE
jgi:mannose-6-phosphate isomerase-like protein (cupin superfamily)